VAAGRRQMAQDGPQVCSRCRPPLSSRRLWSALVHPVGSSQWVQKQVVTGKHDRQM